MPWASPSLNHHGSNGDPDGWRGVAGSTLVGAVGIRAGRLISSLREGWIEKATLTCLVHTELLKILAPVVSFAIADFGLVVFNKSSSRPLIHPNECFSLSLSDTGPGLTVPEEQLSHGCDSSYMSGHAIPAVLCGNQYAVLFDTEPTEDEILHGDS